MEDQTYHIQCWFDFMEDANGENYLGITRLISPQEFHIDGEVWHLDHEAEPHPGSCSLVPKRKFGLFAH